MKTLSWKNLNPFSMSAREEDPMTGQTYFADLADILKIELDGVTYITDHFLLIRADRLADNRNETYQEIKSTEVSEETTVALREYLTPGEYEPSNHLCPLFQWTITQAGFQLVPGPRNAWQILDGGEVVGAIAGRDGNPALLPEARLRTVRAVANHVGPLTYLSTAAAWNLAEEVLALIEREAR